MKVVFTPSGGAATTLGDDTNKLFTKLEQLGLMGKEQLEEMFGAAAMYRAPLLNTSGNCVFTVKKSHANRDAAFTYFASQIAMISLSGSLVYTADANTLTMNPANLIGCVLADIDGVAWTLRYTFGITTIVSP